MFVASLASPSVARVTKQGISSIELGRRLGATQTTAWKIKTKLAEVMRIAGESERLDGRIEMDDAYLGGQRSGGKTGANFPPMIPCLPLCAGPHSAGAREHASPNLPRLRCGCRCLRLLQDCGAPAASTNCQSKPSSPLAL